VLPVGSAHRFAVSLMRLDLGDVRLGDVILGQGYILPGRLDHEASGGRGLRR